MKYKAIINGENIVFHTNICINDIVTLVNPGYIYSTFRSAYMTVWGKNTTSADIMYYPNKGSKWTVVQVISHYDSHQGGILFAIQDRQFHKLIIGASGVKLFRKRKRDTYETIQVKTVKRIIKDLQEF